MISTDTSLEIQRRMDAIYKCIDWVQQNNSKDSSRPALLDSFEFREKQGGIGLFAKQPVAKGSPIFKVPIDCVVFFDHKMFSGFIRKVAMDASKRYTALKQEKPGKVSLFHAENIRAHVVIFLLLSAYRYQKTQNEKGAENMAPMTKDLRKAASFFRPYLDTLPSSFPEFPTNWTEKEVSSLGDSDLHGKITAYREHAEEIWRICVLPALSAKGVDEKLRSILPRKEHERQSIYYDAMAIVVSRAHGEGNGSLHPIVDLINGAPDGTQEVNLTLIDGLYTTRDVKEGEEMITKYGVKTTPEFVIDYGFAPRSNPYDEVILTLPENWLIPADDVVRWQVLSKIGLEEWIIRSKAWNCPFKFSSKDVNNCRKGIMPLDEVMGFHLLEFYLTILKEDLEFSRALLDDHPIQPKRRGLIRHYVMRMFDMKLESISDAKFKLGEDKTSLRSAIAKQALEAEYQLLLQWRHAFYVQWELDEWKDSSGNLICADKPENEDHCATCNRTINLRLCARCKAIKYCCVECQRDDWKSGHKVACVKKQ